MALTVSILQGGTNSHATTSEEVNYGKTDYAIAGVVGAYTNTSGVAPATGGFAANAQGTPAMFVDVSAGSAVVTATPTSGNSQNLRVKNSATSSVTILANSTGGTRYDWVYIKIDPDKAKDPDSGADDVATLVTSRSTSSSADNGTPPTYGTLLAVVTVANGASSITNGNIADKRIQSGMTPGDATILPHMFVGNTSQGASTPTTWTWTTWSPAYSNITVGNGTVTAAYMKIGKTVHFYWGFTMGSTSSIGSSPTITFPIAPSANQQTATAFNHSASYRDVSASQTYPAFLRPGSTTFNLSYFVNVSQLANLSATAPFTWTTSDTLNIAGSYEAA